MLSDATIAKREEITQRLGFSMPELCSASVPEALRSFIPLAEFWGLPEEGAVVELLDAAEASELATLVAQFREISDALDKWLLGPESHRGAVSEEYFRFSCLYSAYELARSRLGHQENA